ncbi:MAG: HDIG domain-containing protein [Herpetosiphon sp.]|nr:HDIG domain-containing protein [Herpetosiphon sp.]
MGHSYADAEQLLNEWVQSESLRKHCLAVSTSMRHMARRSGADEEVWAIAGLLHDMDYERHPNLEHKDDAHPFVGVAYLREHGWSEEICRGILSHADYSHVEPISPMEKTLRAVDELSGFVTAATLVRPDKSIHSLEASSVKKKMKDKAFARAVNRQDMLDGAAMIEMPLDDLIGEVITALRGNAVALGLQGQ